MAQLARPRDDRWIAGVCSGIGHRFGIDPTLVRWLFVLSCVLPGTQLFAYLLLWAFLPDEEPAARG